MCLAVPGRVVEIVDEAKNIAAIEAGGTRRNINIGMLQGDERPGVGDWVLFHIGFALARIDEQEAVETQRILELITQDPFAQTDVVSGTTS